MTSFSIPITMFRCPEGLGVHACIVDSSPIPFVVLVNTPGTMAGGILNGNKVTCYASTPGNGCGLICCRVVHNDDAPAGGAIIVHCPFL
jgi:hypothetical protein